MRACGSMSRSPYGERGLKSVSVSGVKPARVSLSLRRAWIEMPRPMVLPHRRLAVALLTESVD